MVGRERRLTVEIVGRRTLVAYWLTSQRRFVNVQRNSLKQLTVGGNIGPCIEQNKVANHNFTLGYFRGVAISDDLDSLIVVDLIQDGKCTVGASPRRRMPDQWQGVWQ